MRVLKTLLILICYHLFLGGVLMLVVYKLGFHWYTVILLSIITVAFNFIDRLSDKILRNAQTRIKNKE